jgi:hypothetical protein
MVEGCCTRGIGDVSAAYREGVSLVGFTVGSIDSSSITGREKNTRIVTKESSSTAKAYKSVSWHTTGRPKRLQTCEKKLLALLHHQLYNNSNQYPDFGSLLRYKSCFSCEESTYELSHCNKPRRNGFKKSTVICKAQV